MTTQVDDPGREAVDGVLSKSGSTETVALPRTDTATVPDPWEAYDVRTSVVIPVFNEAAALTPVLASLFRVIDDTFEVIVVDDGSSDRSGEVARSFPCRVLRHTVNKGKGAALRTGLDGARGRCIVFVDGDNTYPVELIPMMANLLDRFDLVRGIRSTGRENIPLLNRVGNRLFDGLLHALHSVDGDDLLSGMYGGCRDRLLELGLQANGFDIEAEIIVKSHARGLTCALVPIDYVERVGDKKLRAFRDGARILYRILRLRIAASNGHALQDASSPEAAQGTQMLS